MRIVPLAELQQVFSYDAILKVTEQALVAHAAGLVQAPLPGQLLFPDVPGDCHVKYGHVAGSATFVVKVATGFYANGDRGLPVNNGLILTFDAATGAPITLLLDEGWLTIWRTAAATALAATRLAPPGAKSFGVIGGGTQASATLEWIARLRRNWRRMVWARNEQQAIGLAERHSAHRAKTPEALISDVDIVITTTPAAAPLFDAETARAGQLFIGVGADSPGKQELPPALFERAGWVVVDDIAQCLDHGDWGAAVRAGRSTADAAVMLGDVLGTNVALKWMKAGVGIIDLTGIAAEDIAIAQMFSVSFPIASGSASDWGSKAV